MIRQGHRRQSFALTDDRKLNGREINGFIPCQHRSLQQHEDWATDLLILNNGHVTRTTTQLATPTINFHSTPMGGKRAVILNHYTSALLCATNFF
ncbi:hypothetical protein TNCV_986861 [Trichonephila clavipes]|nr:hypothetical protein TNCV_986861 [Trichonephila clavipes]